MQQAAELAGIEYGNFVNSIRSEKTKQQYIYCLTKYLKFLNLSNPTELMFSRYQADTIEPNRLYGLSKK